MLPLMLYRPNSYAFINKNKYVKHHINKKNGNSYSKHKYVTFAIISVFRNLQMY